MDNIPVVYMVRESGGFINTFRNAINSEIITAVAAKEGQKNKKVSEAFSDGGFG